MHTLLTPHCEHSQLCILSLRHIVSIASYAYSLGATLWAQPATHTLLVPHCESSQLGRLSWHFISEKESAAVPPLMAVPFHKSQLFLLSWRCIVRRVCCASRHIHELQFLLEMYFSTSHVSSCTEIKAAINYVLYIHMMAAADPMLMGRNLIIYFLV
jgi:hypothetical protein